ncbi:MAG: hypothetical protein KatS3mg070_1331 [Meiothermus sp.]|mgnify:CR=1 FL=1|uniref:Uncharacterized protein n=1 Tax=Meiothermus ruber TaxID=277 RepID=A0A7C3HE12_MEIRU|nr:MAG: hypothetical protein KatS3mg070_1331 [Meiothermus sp.]
MQTLTSSTPWLEPLLAERTRTLVDEFGSFYAWLEGSYGGGTLLLWMKSTWLEEVLPQLPRQFKGRIVLGLDASEGYAAPFARALYWANPRWALVISPGEGLGLAYPGRKEVAEGEWVSWDDPREARQLEVVPRPEFSYLEHRAYAPWNVPAPAPLPTIEGPAVGAVGWQQGIPTYGLGLVGLDRSLQTLLEVWRMC